MVLTSFPCPHRAACSHPCTTYHYLASLMENLQSSRSTLLIHVLWCQRHSYSGMTSTPSWMHLGTITEKLLYLSPLWGVLFLLPVRAAVFCWM